MNEIHTKNVSVDDVIDFWFVQISPKQWWVKDIELDLHIKNTYGATLQAAIKGELQHWRKDAQGRLAEIIVLDQFSRNIYRETFIAILQQHFPLTISR